MFIPLEEIAPHLLGAFMIALACVPLVFVWQDRGRRRAERDHTAKQIGSRAGLAGSR